MILHVAQLDKFIPPFVELISEEFTNEEHQFWLRGSLEEYPVEPTDSVYVCGDGLWNKVKGYGRLIRQLHGARKIMLHGLFNINIVRILAFCPWLLPKCYWIIWGGDLYSYLKARKTWRSRIREALRRVVIRRIGHLVTYIEGDVELARRWYGAIGVHHECLMYLSNVVDPFIITERHEQPVKSGLNILMGNSADSSNNHLEAMERLLPYKEHEIRIIVPLSYGDQSHAQKVIRQGRQWFGEKFVPITEFMSFEQYRDVLKSVDIAMFNHQRQQAMGNTITLLGMGKTVFMRSDQSHWQFLTSLDIRLKDIENFELQVIDCKIASNNARIVQTYFTKAVLTKQLSGIYEK